MGVDTLDVRVEVPAVGRGTHQVAVDVRGDVGVPVDAATLEFDLECVGIGVVSNVFEI